MLGRYRRCRWNGRFLVGVRFTCGGQRRIVLTRPPASFQVGEPIPLTPPRRCLDIAGVSRRRPVQTHGNRRKTPHRSASRDGQAGPRRRRERRVRDQQRGRSGSPPRVGTPSHPPTGGRAGTAAVVGRQSRQRSRALCGHRCDQGRGPTPTGCTAAISGPMRSAEGRRTGMGSFRRTARAEDDLVEISLLLAMAALGMCGWLSLHPCDRKKYNLHSVRQVPRSRAPVSDLHSADPSRRMDEPTQHQLARYSDGPRHHRD